ncbi:AraC-like DNA-binding protein [Algoriphagus sp. 4150]|uniref:AraC family transcriptional regulator n=1 Tax=Algoriphagus sp. 4150 TaxID=2817756 RepID=UPI00285FA9A5|nr:AraC family transcriptional regulator [Algoriphagus sp. 4150]MDR7128038.1 AraC-like DNA-binding protein [Algoriphagus sp. 4150]
MASLERHPTNHQQRQKLNSRDIEYKSVKPDKSLSDFVESFWMLHNPNDSDKQVIILPDGRVDLFFTQSAIEPFHITLLGIGTNPEHSTIKANRITFAISFKPLATEYLLKENISDLLNKGKNVSDDFWDFSSSDLLDFELFCQKATQKIKSLLPKELDSKKQKLFELIYNSNGAMTVEELSEKVFWSSRQINRYFNHQYGIPLKAYCNILRFRASFQHIKEGKLFPEQNFADQAHFIKEVKKLAGVNPKQLSKNQNDRFIQFSTLPEK